MGNDYQIEICVQSFKDYRHPMRAEIWNEIYRPLKVQTENKTFYGLSCAYLFLVCISQIFHASLGFTKRCISNRCLVGSTDQACSSGFYFRIAWKSMKRPFFWNCSLCHFSGVSKVQTKNRSYLVNVSTSKKVRDIF